MASRGKTQPNQAYQQAGVDIDAGEALIERIKPFAKATARKGAGAALGGFGALFDIKEAGFADPVLVASNDGVGTKLKIAIEAGLHDTIGVDLVAMCANDVVVQGAEPLFFLDYFACGKLDVDVAAKVIGGIAEGCWQAGAALIGGETAEMPGVYAPGDYDLAGFCVGAAERGRLLPRGDVRPGDVVLGLASTGAHSNGFSLVRKIVREKGLEWGALAPFENGKSLAHAFITPTRIYVKAALAAHKTQKVKAFAHITGGGLPGNVPRVLPEGTAAALDLGAIPPQPVFGWLSQAGKVSEADMLRTFNCGVGFVAVAARKDVDVVRAALEGEGESVFEFGVIEAAESGAPAQVTFSGKLDLGA